MWAILSPAIMPLMGVVLGAAISFGATYWFTARKEMTDSNNWRRDRALEVYVDVLKAGATVHFAAISAYIAECNTEEQLKHIRLIGTAGTELHGLGNRLMLLSPKEMFDDFKNLAGYLSTQIVPNSLKCPKIPQTEWDKILGAEFVRLHSNFTLAARNDLGVHVPHLSAEELMKFNQQWPETPK